ncbi:hypothetical protein AK812_SmicGene39207 [Symbiodinium microadriaticum]|uniref:Uncharacterized protein n=1 Tax=Symbiodinium microadriaticum TaxID=2951 RepID=A0A1Q9CBT0_SYMMI|nr:hypothetical protein AK812_SmicGene39207 [Symbiodinium microadriaticum]
MFVGHGPFAASIDLWPEIQRPRGQGAGDGGKPAVRTIRVEADAIHDALVEVLRGQLAEIMSVYNYDLESNYTLIREWLEWGKVEAARFRTMLTHLKNTLKKADSSRSPKVDVLKQIFRRKIEAELELQGDVQAPEDHEVDEEAGQADLQQADELAAMLSPAKLVVRGAQAVNLPVDAPAPGRELAEPADGDPAAAVQITTFACKAAAIVENDRIGKRKRGGGRGRGRGRGKAVAAEPQVPEPELEEPKIRKSRSSKLLKGSGAGSSKDHEKPKPGPPMAKKQSPRKQKKVDEGLETVRAAGLPGLDVPLRLERQSAHCPYIGAFDIDFVASAFERIHVIDYIVKYSEMTNGHRTRDLECLEIFSGFGCAVAKAFRDEKMASQQYDKKKDGELENMACGQEPTLASATCVLAGAWWEADKLPWIRGLEVKKTGLKEKAASFVVADHIKDLHEPWSEANLLELRRFLEDAVFKGEYYCVAGVLEFETLPSAEVFNNFCDHYGLVRTGGKDKSQVLQFQSAA